jgi:formate hydrogenlyase subunit 3/multisubunit Na+/H+ antiporter MnhD subunit
MSVPVLVIILPVALSIVLFIIRKRSTTVNIIAAVFCFLMALIILKMPIDQGLPIGKISFNFSSTWSVLGRKFIVEKTDLSFLTMLFALGGIWFVAAIIIKPTKPFAAIGVGILGLLSAAISVEPFIYSALIIELVTLLSVSIMIERGKPSDKGLLKYLIYQSLGLPFILFTGWVLNVAGVNPSDQVFLYQAILFLGLGFALWLGVFPFHSWVPLLVEGAHPFIAGFTLVMVPTVLLLLIVDFLNGFAWLRDAPIFYSAMTTTGSIMVVTGGIWAAFSKNAARLMGYAIIVETGLSLISIGLHSRVGLEYLVMSMVPRIIAILIWSIVLAQIKSQVGGFEQDKMSEFTRSNPVTTTAMYVAMFSIAGLPVLGSFALKLGLLASFGKDNISGTVWVLIGLVGYFVGCIRQLAGLVSFELKTNREEKRFLMIFLMFSIFGLIVIGLFPKTFLRNLIGLLNSFKFLNWQ